MKRLRTKNVGKIAILLCVLFLSGANVSFGQETDKTIEVTNKSDWDLNYFRIGPQGNEVSVGKLKMGETKQLKTKVGVEWVFRDVTGGKEISRFTVKKDTVTFGIFARAVQEPKNKASGENSGPTVPPGKVAPIDVSAPDPSPTITVIPNADDSLDIAWLSAKGKTYISTFSGNNWSQTKHREITNALDIIGGFTRDEAGNMYLATFKREKIASADASTYRKKVAHLLKIPPQTSEAELFVDLNTKKLNPGCSITNPSTSGGQGTTNCSSRLVYGNNSFALTFGQNNSEIHDSSHLMALGTDKSSLYGDGGYSQHCWDLRLIFDGTHFVMAQVFEGGVGLSKLTKSEDKLTWSDHVMAYKHASKDNQDNLVGFGGLLSTDKGYLLVCSYGDSNGPLLAVTAPKNFETGTKFDNGANFNKPIPGKALTLAQPPKGDSYIRSRLVDIGSGKYIVLYEQMTLESRAFKQTLALVMNGDGKVVQDPVILQGARIQHGSEPIYLPKSGKAAWVVGDEAERKMKLFTLDNSLKLNRFELQLP